jgi:phosphoribosylanthranilate isomerase
VFILKKSKVRTRVKICGITRVQDALAAAKSGADAIGLVFYEKSPRFVSIQRATEIMAALPPFVSVVGLFVNASQAEVQRVLDALHLDVLQFHGDEAPEDCHRYGLPYIKAVRVKQDTNLLQYAFAYHDAQALLLDTYSEGAVGGTGLVFDWSLVPTQLSLPIVLAGGLDAGNVAQAIQQTKPYAVDVSGGVEAIINKVQAKGIKDADKIAAFIQGVNNASV